MALPVHGNRAVSKEHVPVNLCFHGQGNYSTNESVLLFYRGVWNVPYISVAILMSGKWLQKLGSDLPTYSNVDLDPDMALPHWMRMNVMLNKMLSTLY